MRVSGSSVAAAATGVAVPAAGRRRRRSNGRRVPRQVGPTPRGHPIESIRCTLLCLPNPVGPTRSVLCHRACGVRTILSQIDVDATVAEQVIRRARGEGIALPSEMVERLQYVFVS